MAVLRSSLDPSSPAFATNVERLLAAELDVDWFEYDQYVNELGVKK